MATFLSNRDGGKTNEEGHYRFQTKSFTGNVNNGLLVKQNNPLSMSVLVEAGDARIPYQEYGYTWWNNGDLSVGLNTADPSNPRDDVIVAYVDRGETPDPNVTNNPDIVKIIAVAGSPSASPTPPNNTVIQTSVGAGNPFMILAQVRVGAGVSTISNGNITDKRIFASPVIADKAVTPAKLGDSGWITVSGTGFNYRKIGTVVYLRGYTSNATGAVSGIAVLFTLPVGYRPISSTALPIRVDNGTYNWCDVNNSGEVRVSKTDTTNLSVQIGGSFCI